MHSGQILCAADGSVSPGRAQVSSPLYPFVLSALVLFYTAALELSHTSEPRSAVASPKISFAVTSSLFPLSQISLSSGV